MKLTEDQRTHIDTWVSLGHLDYEWVPVADLPTDFIEEQFLFETGVVLLTPDGLEGELILVYLKPSGRRLKHRKEQIWGLYSDTFYTRATVSGSEGKVIVKKIGKTERTVLESNTHGGGYILSRGSKTELLNRRI